MIELKSPYLMFLGDAADQLAAKTAKGIVDWRPEICIGQIKLGSCNADLGIPNLTLSEGREKGAKTLIVGVANRGGVISKPWEQVFIQALELGFDIASGLHSKLTDIPEIKRIAELYECNLFDVRHPTESFDVGTGEKRNGNRLLTVGTDCSIGKKYTALAIERELVSRGIKASFRATGQTGIFIAGQGVSVDAVISDFISGAVEQLAPENSHEHWDIIEGQGSLFHPSYAGVTAGLIHGSQPDALVLCHEPTRSHMRGLPHYSLPSLNDCMYLNLELAKLTNPRAKFVGIAINTSGLDDESATQYLSQISTEFKLPCVDPVRTGVSVIVDQLFI